MLSESNRVQNVPSEGTAHVHTATPAWRHNDEVSPMPNRRTHRSHPTVHVDGTAAIDVSAVEAIRTGEAEVTLTINAGRSGTIQLTGNGWDLHRLVIDIDRQLTRLSRSPTLSTSY
jgi:hypothetical protein